ncbi:MAG: hypothetical protein GY760_08090 [Deltaproteobacteria bacterium]|nr:hypothetical protein [Deltaproteobacteria bacterium]
MTPYFFNACWQIKKACQNHLDDLKKSKDKDYPYMFDKDKAEGICEFAELMPHVKGKWMGTFIVLEPWQCFAFCVVIGWVKKVDGFRRYREILWMIPRKNTKSTMGAILCNFLTFADGEKGAEGYTAANSESQAYEVFRPAWLMVKKSPEFQKIFNIEFMGISNTKN